MFVKQCLSLFPKIRGCCAMTYSRSAAYLKYKETKDENIVDNNKYLGDSGSKYKLFKDEDSKEIFDMYEEKLKFEDVLQTNEVHNPFEGLNLRRGETGVFEIEDLVAVLHRDNAQDIFVAEVPPEINFVNYVCIVTGKSKRHMYAIAQFVKKVYKQKMLNSDIIPRIEGQDSSDWIALDLGNIALHIFSKEARQRYDLDTLWAVGPEFDTETNRKDPIVDLLEKHSMYLKDLEPAS